MRRACKARPTGHSLAIACPCLQVCVNDIPYPARQDRAGLLLAPGDVLTVQGLNFKLVMA